MADIISPPNDPNIEQAVIGAMLLDASEAKRALQLLDEKWFYNEKNKKLYGLIKEKMSEQVDVDIVLMASWLTQRGILADVGGTLYMSDCMEKVSTSAHTLAYINQLRALYYDREINLAAYNLTKQPTFQNTEIVRKLCHERETANSIGAIDMRDSVDTLMALTEPLEKGLYEVFDMTQLDKYHNGMSCGNILTIAARPGVGKTVLATQIVMNFAKKYNEPALYFSTEMTHEETMMRMLAPESKVSGWKWKKRYFQQDDIPDIKNAIERMVKLPIFMIDKPSPTLADIQAGVLATKCKLMVLDYIQRTNLEAQEREGGPQALGRMMMGIKNLARELNIIIVVLAQMNRDADKLTARQRPQLADIKGSGEIEQESDCIMLVWKHNKKDPDTKKGIVPENINTIHPVEAIVAKNRHGQSDVSVQLVFDEKLIQVREWNEKEEEYCRELAMRAQNARQKKEQENGTDKKSHYPETPFDSGSLSGGGYTDDPE